MPSPQATEPTEKENEYFGILNLQLFFRPCHSMKNKFQLLHFVYSGVIVTMSPLAFFSIETCYTGRQRGLVQSLVANRLFSFGFIGNVFAEVELV